MEQPLSANQLLKLLQKERLQFENRKRISPEEVINNPVIADYLEGLKKQGELFCSEPLSVLPFRAFKLYDTTGNRLAYEDYYFNRRFRLAVYALLTWLYQKPEDLEQLEDVMWAVLNEYTWTLPAHLGGNSLNEKANPCTPDLFACETAQALSEIADMLKDMLHPAILLRCKSEVKRRVLEPFLHTSSNWETQKNNWAAVCSGSIGMAAIYTLEDNALAEVIAKVLPVMDCFLDSFEADGTCLEGLGYWTYGMSYFVSFSDLLLQRTNGICNLFEDRRVYPVAAFQSKCYFKNGRTVSFSDGFDKDSFRMGISGYLFHYFKDRKICLPPAANAAAYNSDPCSRFAQLYRDIIWSCYYTIQEYKPENSVLPEAQWMIFHGQDGSGGAIKGGCNDEPHNHNDIGSFLFHLESGSLLADLGCGEYTKEYFGPSRYEILCNRSYGHNVPYINGCEQKDGREYQTAQCSFQEDGTSASMDLAPAYGLSALRSLIRTLTFDDQKKMLSLTDSYQFDELPASIEEHFITRQKPRLTAKSIILRTEAGQEASLHYEHMSVSFEEQIHMNHDGKPETIYIVKCSPDRLEKEFTMSFTLSW